VRKYVANKKTTYENRQTAVAYLYRLQRMPNMTSDIYIAAACLTAAERLCSDSRRVTVPS